MQSTAVNHDEAWFKNRNLVKLYLMLVPGALIASAGMGYDSSMMNGVQGVDRWVKFFNNPQGSLLGIMNAILPLGAVFATWPAAFLSDRYGRRISMAVGDVIVIIGTIIQTASMNMAMFLVSRFIIGFGITITSASAPMMVTELAHPRSRATLTSMYNTLWYLGSVIAAWTTYGTYRIPSDWSWRLPAVFQAVPALMNIAAVWLLPESPRWLISKDRAEEAQAILYKYHANDNLDDPFVSAECSEIRETLRLELEGSRSWKELVQTKANRHRTLLVICCAFFPQWSGAGLVSYYLAPVLRNIGITSQERITLINGLIQIWNMIVAMTGANLVQRVGRRPLFLAATCGMLAAMVSWTASGSVFHKTRSEAAGAGVLTCIIFFVTSYNICWNPLAVAYPVEILPFPIRAKGMALLMGSIKGASFFNQFVNPIGLQNLAWKYYIVYCFWLGIVLTVVYFMFPETKGRSLEEISEIFDKKHGAGEHDEKKNEDVKYIEDNSENYKQG